MWCSFCLPRFQMRRILEISVFRILSRALSVPRMMFDFEALVPISVATSWDQVSAAGCTDVSGAIPGGPAKCSNPDRINIPLIPVPVTLQSFSVE